MGMTHCTGFVGALVFGCLLAVVPVSSAQVASDEPSSSGGLAPTPGLTPGQVVQIQLEANKLHTGPLPRFISMIHQRPYSLMLAYDNVAYDPVEIVDDTARQRVTLIGSGLVVAYEFYLSRQTEGACVGCWLTDAVIAKRPTGLQVQS
jgi:hypothetical protein